MKGTKFCEGRRLSVTRTFPGGATKVEVRGECFGELTGGVFSEEDGPGLGVKTPAVKLLRRKWKGRSSTAAGVKALRREKTRQKPVTYMPRA